MIGPSLLWTQLKGMPAMKNGLAHLILVSSALTSMASAQSMMDPGNAVNGSIEMTYQSLYMWRGFDVFPNKSAMQVTADVSHPGTGLGMKVDVHWAATGGFENAERWDYNPYYEGSLNPDSQTAVDYRVGYTYYNFPDQANQLADMHEFHGIVSLPNVAGGPRLVPAYALIKMWPQSSTAGGSDVGGDVSGYLHILMLNYEFELPGYTLDTPEQSIRLHSELIYNDGVNLVANLPGGGGPVDHDWSNFVVGAATDIVMPANIVLTPAVNYQVTLDRSVHGTDELWATLGAKFRF